MGRIDLFITQVRHCNINLEMWYMYYARFESVKLVQKKIANGKLKQDLKYF